MALHSVRFDDETEEALEQVCQATGRTVSEALKAGVVALRDGLAHAARPLAFDVYQTLDLGPGGYAKTPARHAKQGVRAIVAKKIAEAHGKQHDKKHGP